jgi:hypothetical protein
MKKTLRFISMIALSATTLSSYGIVSRSTDVENMKKLIEG